MLKSVTTLLAVAAIAVFAANASAADWPQYQHDNARSGFTGADTTINPSTAPTLAPRWTVRAGDTISNQATIVNNTVYWGSWDGLQHATDASSGAELWHTYIGDETKSDCSPPHLGVASSATFAPTKINGKQTDTLFVGGGNGSLYALNAKSGAIIWSRSFGSPQDGYFIWSSPTLYNGSLYVGVASIGDCPLVPGQLVKLNPTNGAVQATFDTVPPGCTGGGIWTSPTVDPASGILYTTTGTTGTCGSAEPYAQAIIALSTKNLALIAAWKPPVDEQVPDGDFGASPTLFTATINDSSRQLVGAANKNGIYYAFDRRSVANGPVWKSQRISSDPDTIASSAWDGAQLYVAGHATTIAGQSCEGSIRAINPSTGSFVWQDCLAGGAAEGALTAVPGVIFEGIGSILYGVSATDGGILFQYQDTSFHWFYSPAAVANGSLYIGNSDGLFFSFTLNGQ